MRAATPITAAAKIPDPAILIAPESSSSSSPSVVVRLPVVVAFDTLVDDGVGVAVAVAVASRRELGRGAPAAEQKPWAPVAASGGLLAVVKRWETKGMYVRILRGYSPAACMG